MKNVIEFSHVSKHYGTVKAVDDLSFSVPTGTVIALLGPNGAGKTSSMSMMLGLRRPSTGTVKLLDRDPTVPAHRTHIGAMLQQVSLPSKLSVRELIQLFRSYYPHPLAADELIALSGLDADAKKDASSLSGGQQRRLQFALAMAGDPRVLFLDEPTTGMDVSSRRAFWAQLRRFAHDDGRSIVLTTHHLEEADAISDRILVIQHGRLVADGTPSELKTLAGHRFVSFVADTDVTDEQLRRLPDVSDLTRSGRHIRLRTKDSDAVLRALFGQSMSVRDIEVSAGGLEDAFLTLTQASSEEVS